MAELAVLLLLAPIGLAVCYVLGFVMIAAVGLPWAIIGSVVEASWARLRPPTTGEKP